MLVTNGRKLLLVPKGIVSFSKAYVPDRYYNQFVLDFLQNENIRMNTALAQKRKGGTRYVTKKSLNEMGSTIKRFFEKIY